MGVGPRNAERDAHCVEAFIVLEGIGDRLDMGDLSRALTFRNGVTVVALPENRLKTLRA